MKWKDESRKVLKKQRNMQHRKKNCRSDRKLKRIKNVLTDFV